MAWMEKLTMQVGLVDKVTKPLAGINSQIDKVSKASRQGWSNMAMGATTVAAGGMAIQSALGPAIEMDSALQDLHAAGVGEEALKQLSHTALKFSVDYGKSAIDVLGYTTEMRRAMPALPEAMLDSVTKTSAILGAATKSDAETVGQYFRMLYNNQRQAADAMGPDVWAQQVAGMTSMVTSQFGVGMDKLMASVEGMHSLPSTMGVAMEEQLAILGMLQTRMSDGDAVTQFTNLLEGAATAQDKLGVAMLNSQGKMLPIQTILKNIKPLIANMGGAEARTLLDGAGLGDGALLLQQLIGDATTLDKTLGNLRGVRGLDTANAKAKSMAKTWDRLKASWEAIRIAGFSSILPAVNAVISAFTDGAGVVLRWTHLFPNLTKVISYVLLAIVGLSMVTGTWMLIAGLANLATLGFGIALAIITSPIGLLVAGIIALIAAIAVGIHYWDEIKATLADIGVFDALRTAFDTLLTPWRGLIKLIKMALDASNKFLGSNFDTSWMDVNVLPKWASAPENTKPPTSVVNSPLATYRQGGQSRVPAGGLGQQLIQANAAATTANQKPAKVLHIGEVHMTSQNPMTPEQMAENAWLETP